MATDVCVVGGGYTGLSAALHLAEAGYRVVLLEARSVGFGASGRNGGQVGSGQREGALALCRAFGRERTRILWGLAEEAKALLAARIERHRIACDWRPGNLYAATRARHLPEMEAEAAFVERELGYRGYRMVDGPGLRELVATDAYVGGRIDAGGGHLDPLKLVLGIAAAASAAGARLHEGSAVRAVRWGRPVRVETAAGRVRAEHVVLAGNAYLAGLEPRIEATLMPIVNHVVATAPLGAARARALIPGGCCVHASKFVVDYFRLTADHRLVFGGGETYSDRPPADVGAFVRPYLLQVFPQLADLPVEYAWSGRVGITRSRLPHLGRISPGGWFAQGYSGHGVALSQLAGKLIAEAVAGAAERFDVLASLPHRRFPGGRWLRQPLLAAGMLWYALRDRF